MRSVFTAGANSFVIGFAIFIFITMNQGVARAETVTFDWNSFGSFNGGPISSSATLLGLTFNGSSSPIPIATVDTTASTFSLASSTFNFGSFTLIGDPATLAGNTFQLVLVMTFPPVPGFPAISLVGSTLSVTSVGASIQSSSDGSLTIDFSNNPLVFPLFVNTFDVGPPLTVTGTQIGSFSLTLNDINIQPGQTVNVFGNVAAIPEPATLLMLSTGLAGVGAAVWKRRKLKVG